MSVRRDIIEKNTKDLTYMSKMYLVWTEISLDKYSIVYPTNQSNNLGHFQIKVSRRQKRLYYFNFFIPLG